MVLMNLSSITPILISSATLRDGNAKGPADAFGYLITWATISSNKNGITPTYITPSSSAQSLLFPSKTTILRKKSPVFLEEKVSYAFFSVVFTFYEICIYSFSVTTLTIKSSSYCSDSSGSLPMMKGHRPKRSAYCRFSACNVPLCP